MMKSQKLISISTAGYIGFSTLSLAYVAILSMMNPQAPMDLVQVELNNTDAISSIRGIYGGTGLSITIGIIYTWFHRTQLALNFLVLFWGMYALSRLITILTHGALNDFGNQWLVIESTLCITGLLLVFLQKKANE